MRFENKVAVVTGAARGIGKACAERLLSEGAAVVLADIDTDRLASTTIALGSSDGLRRGMKVVNTGAPIFRNESSALSSCSRRHRLRCYWDARKPPAQPSMACAWSPLRRSCSPVVPHCLDRPAKRP